LRCIKYMRSQLRPRIVDAKSDMFHTLILPAAPEYVTEPTNQNTQALHLAAMSQLRVGQGVEPQSAQSTQRSTRIASILSRRWRDIEGLPCPRPAPAAPFTAKKAMPHVASRCRRDPSGSWARCPCYGRRQRSPSPSPLCALRALWCARIRLVGLAT